jgi:hypothetical protein
VPDLAVRGMLTRYPLTRTARGLDEVEVRDVGTRTPKEKSMGMETSGRSCLRVKVRPENMVGSATAEAAKKMGERCIVAGAMSQNR